MEEKYQSLSSWQGGWESVNGNPDVFIFQGYDGNYCLLAYSYDKDYGRGNFSCYEIGSDENGCYIHIGTKNCRLTSEELPYTLHISGWGSYMKN
jgi:hypothetical protein